MSSLTPSQVSSSTSHLPLDAQQNTKSTPDPQLATLLFDDRFTTMHHMNPSHFSDSSDSSEEETQKTETPSQVSSTSQLPSDEQQNTTSTLDTQLATLLFDDRFTTMHRMNPSHFSDSSDSSEEDENDTQKTETPPRRLSKTLATDLTPEQIADLPPALKAAYRADKKKERTQNRGKLRDLKRHILGTDD